eukprot:s508_g11.t1
MTENRTVSEGEVVRKILDNALSGVIQSEGSPPYFNNKTTGETTWDHPLHEHLEELSALALRCLALKSTERWQAAKLLRQRFQAEAVREYRCWYTAEEWGPSSGWWEHPAGVVLPQFYLKIRCAELLQDNDYLRGLFEAEDPPTPEGRIGRTISKLLGLRSVSKDSLTSQAQLSACSTASFPSEGLDDDGSEDEKGIESEDEAAPAEVALLVDSWSLEP